MKSLTFNSGALRRQVEVAYTLARSEGATMLEAEHLLLALAQGESPAAEVLAEFGLNPDGIRAALHAEHTRSLAAVGLDAVAFDVPAPSGMSKPRVGASAKVALENSVKITKQACQKHVDDLAILLALLRPDHGTVPRLLEAAGVDRVALTIRAQALRQA